METCKQVKLIVSNCCLFGFIFFFSVILYFSGECIALALRLSSTEFAPLFCFACWIPERVDLSTRYALEQDSLAHIEKKIR